MFDTEGQREGRRKGGKREIAAFAETDKRSKLGGSEGSDHEIWNVKSPKT